MVALRDRRHLRRLGYGVALGAGIAFAPFAIAAASADPGQVPQGPAAVAQQSVQSGTAAQTMRPGVVAAKPVTQPVADQARVAPRTQSVDRRSVVVIGASVSAGKEVSAADAYPGQVRELSGRPVYVSARSGAAYNDGSIAQLTRAANLPARSPALVVLQAGTNDVGARPAAVAGQVRQVVGTVRRQAPGARIALVTVFPSIHKGEAAEATDQAIIGAAQSVDPSVVVISPLEEEWRYGASSDGHPGSSAHLRIAERISALV